MYERIVDPSSIAVVGASNDLSKPGGSVAKNIADHGYAGDLWAVNPKHDDVLGLATFKTVGDLPGAPELAIIAIPARGVRGVVEELAEMGTRAVIILSAGFGEVSEDGKREELALVEIADRHGMTMIGPNCMGVLTPSYAGVFAGPIPTLKPGCIDIISGSGATADFLVELAMGRGLPLSSMFTVGNGAQVGVEDILGMMDEWFGPGSARVKALYMESVKKPQKLLRHARSLIAKGCSIVGIKSGTTGAGKRAAASHTGAMASDDTAVQALFEKAGIIRVSSKSELLDVASVLLTAGPIDGRNVCVLTDAGGPGVLLADELARQGLEVPLLRDATRERLAEVLWPGSSVLNPIDCLSTRTFHQIEQAVKIISEEESDRIDVMPLIMGDPGMGEISEMYEVIAQAMDESPIPVIPVFPSPITSARALEDFKARGKSYFADEVQLGRSLGRVINRPRPMEPAESLPGYRRDEIARVLRGEGVGGSARALTAEGARTALEPDTAAAILEAAGIRMPGQAVACRVEDLDKICAGLGFPVVMKVVGPLHKTDVGGVVLDVSSVEAARDTWRRLMSIDEATGVLVQPMIEGTELIVGAAREEGFGTLVMFGLGGVFTEVLGDVKFALAPLGMEESERMVDSIRGRRLLDGVRGGRGVDVGAVADMIARVGLLVSDFPEIVELDLNPIKGYGSELYAVDARIIVDAA
ncbi:MAG TPA: CoA ligase [Firmicutes bacterium]|nr:CoA ligase [Bacillota bacterium]